MKRHIFTIEEINQICELYSNGKSSREIGLDLNINKNLVTTALRDQNILIRTDRKIRPKMKLKLLGFETDIIEEYLKNHKSLKNIADKYQVSPTPISNILKRAAIQLRPAKPYWTGRHGNQRIADNMRSRIRDALKRTRSQKASGLTNLLNCSIQELKQHLESKFQVGMTWDNYGYGSDKWNIDHIIPCARFDLTKAEEQYKCFNYTNLQPLWQSLNFKKRDHIITP